MIVRHHVLVQRIRLELEGIERTVDAVRRHWEKARSLAVDQDAYLNSVALNLHGLYSGLERIFELIAIELDGGVLGGESWHLELLKQMTLELPKIRPPVIQVKTADRLDEYRKFRHLIRNIYATNLDPNRMEHLVNELPSLWKEICEELNLFNHFLGEIADSEI